MKRPYIPLSVRLAVLERQAFNDRHFDRDSERQLAIEWYLMCCGRKSRKHKIGWLRELLFRGRKAELDHDPALELRRFNKRTGRYTPDANDPNYLVYRSRENHLHKTTGRKPGAERTVTSKGSDTWLAKKFRRLEKPRGSRSRIPSRPFSKGQRPIRRTT